MVNILTYCRTMADEYLFEETMQHHVDMPATTSRSVIPVFDQQNGSYQTQISFDSSSLNSGERFLSLREGWITVPYTLTMTTTSNIAASVSAWCVGMKSGSHQIVDSVQVQFNGTQVCKVNSYSNMFMSYKLNTSMSRDALRRQGSVSLFYPDSAGSSIYEDAAIGGSAGKGLCNNVVVAQLVSATNWNLGHNPDQVNVGFYNRLRLTSLNGIADASRTYGILDGAAKTLPYMGVDVAAVRSKANTVLMNNFRIASGSGAGAVYQWDLLLVIKLAHLHDWFNKMPLIKSCNMQVYINYNACVQKLTTTAVAMRASASAVIGRTCPFMIAAGNNGGTAAVAINVTSATTGLVRTRLSTGPDVFQNVDQVGGAAANNGIILSSGTANIAGPVGPMNAVLAAVAAGTDSITIASGIGASCLNAGSPPITGCRLYIPAYTLTLEALERLSADPRREVRYNDYQSYKISSQAPGATVNNIISSSQTRPRSLVVIPQVNSTVVAGFNDFGDPCLSPFDSAPATSMPLVQLQQFQVLLAGQEIFNSDLRYQFENFLEEVEPDNALNGGLDLEVSNGLIGFYEFNNNYRYYVANLARGQDMNDRSGKSVQLNCVNGSAATIDLYTFLEYERRCTVDCITGELLAFE